jgi:hypothetical protein
VVYRLTGGIEPEFKFLGSAAGRHVWTALAVAGLAQALMTCGGSLVPDQSGLYGAPLPVGEATPNFLFGGPPSFFFPFWVINVLLTAAVLWGAAIWLKGTIGTGLLAAGVGVVAAYVTVFFLPGLEHRVNPLVIWGWMLVVVAAVWGGRRFRPPYRTT